MIILDAVCSTFADLVLLAAIVYFAYWSSKLITRMVKCIVDSTDYFTSTDVPCETSTTKEQEPTEN